MEKRIYIAVLLSLVVSACMFAVSLFGSGELWLRYYVAYLVVAIGHVWYVLVMLAKEDLKPREYLAYNYEPVAIIIPTFNEKPDLLRRTVQSALDCHGNVRVYVVNDGSTNPIDWDDIRYMSPRVTLGGYPDNRGKREAIRYAVRSLLRDEKYVVLTDSDTILDNLCVLHLVEPLLTNKVGAVAGDVRILNAEENWLTKLCSAYYWIAFNISRRSQSALGQVSCCSGALASYKREFLDRNIDEFADQQFAGAKCTYGEDRHLTNMALKDGYDVVYAQGASAITEAPTNFKQFWKQQLRWRRGFYQEAIYAIPFMWKVKPVLFFEIVVWELLWPMLSIGVFLSALVYAITDPALLFFGIIPSLIGVAIVRYMPIFFYGRQHVLRMIGFTILSNFIMLWQGVIALLTVRIKSWSTR
jgi:hyaluronan synthase